MGEGVGAGEFLGGDDICMCLSVDGEVICSGCATLTNFQSLLVYVVGGGE